MRLTRNIRRWPETQGDMTPMIDMVFQLIAFFMVALNFADVEQEQSINLPSSELAKPPDVAYEEPLTVQITREETVLFGGEEMPPEQLLSAMRREAQFMQTYDKKVSDATVVIRADESVKTGIVQRVIEICQEVQFEKFALRSRQSDESTLIGP
ncbi:MAG: biopolymer transporter ExbD [Pirellulales bacterium]